jgi:hypothetical protein
VLEKNREQSDQKKRQQRIQQALDNVGSHLLGKGSTKKAVDFIITGFEVWNI